jgi:hypothetical protein
MAADFERALLNSKIFEVEFATIVRRRHDERHNDVQHDASAQR